MGLESTPPLSGEQEAVELDMEVLADYGPKLQEYLDTDELILTDFTVIELREVLATVRGFWEKQLKTFDGSASFGEMVRQVIERGEVLKEQIDRYPADELLTELRDEDLIERLHNFFESQGITVYT